MSLVSAPLLVLVRGLISLVSFGTSPTCDPHADEIDSYTDVECDDGSSPFDENGDVRLECTIDGCGPVDDVCYFNDYFERCLDVYGRPTGRCHVADMTCEGKIACFVLWVECDGQYGCTDKRTFGCGQGYCKEEKGAT